MDEALVEQQREAYKKSDESEVTGVDPMKKRKAAQLEAVSFHCPSNASSLPRFD